LLELGDQILSKDVLSEILSDDYTCRRIIERGNSSQKTRYPHLSFFEGFWGILVLPGKKMEADICRRYWEKDVKHLSQFSNVLSKQKERVFKSLNLVINRKEFENGLLCRLLLEYAVEHDILDLLQLLTSNKKIDLQCIFAPIIKDPFHHRLWPYAFSRSKYSIPSNQNSSLEKLLFLAIKSKNETIIHDLLHHPFLNPNALNGVGDTFLQVAVRNRLKITIVRDIIRSGVDITHVNQKDDETAMMIARRVSYKKAYNLLFSTFRHIQGEPITP